MRIMRAISITIITTLLFTFLSCDKDENEPTDYELTDLHVEITGLRNNDGIIQFELTDENENVIKTFSSEIVNKACIIIISDLSYGSYAFKYFHDENENEELDVEILIPKEGYGFSNNATGTFGPPAIDEMIFDYKEPMKMECVITYL